MSEEQKEAMVQILKFVRHQLMAMNLAEKKKVDGIIKKHPEITVQNLVDYWVELVYRNS